MEHMDSGSLTSLITKFQIPEPLIAYACREVCQGLQCDIPSCHQSVGFSLHIVPGISTAAAEFTETSRATMCWCTAMAQ
jgi:hypothetical protein